MNMQRSSSFHGRRAMPLVVGFVVGIVLASSIGVAVAHWLSSDSNDAAALADTLAGGPTPSVGTVNGRNVALSWSSSTTASEGGAVTGYTVTRWSAATGGTPGAPGGTCAGVVTTTSCTDRNVPPGTWHYTVTPELHSWVGPEGPRSGGATVGSPTFSLDETSFTAAGGTVQATVTDFLDHESVTFCLDSASTSCTQVGATVVPAGGTKVATLTLPTPTSVGGHTIHAVGNGASAPAGVTITVTPAAATKLVFTTGAQSTTVPISTGLMAVQRQDPYGNPTTTGSISVDLTSTSGGGSFRNTTDTATISSVPIGTGDSSAGFRYVDTTAGSPTITASSAGLTGATQGVTVGKGAQAITFTTTVPGDAAYGGTYTVAATASPSGLPVAVTAGSASVCTISGSTVSFVGVGACVINANQPGNADYDAAPQVQQQLDVGKATLTVTASSASFTYGGPVSSISPSYSGFVGSDAPANSLSQVPTCGTTATSASGVAGSPYASSCAGGTSTKYAFAYVNGTVTVLKANQTITFNAPASGSAGGTATLTATVGSGLPVALTSSTTSVCTVSGSTVSYLTGGTCTLNANQAGDANHNAAPQVSRTITVSSSLTITTATDRRQNQNFGQVTFSGTGSSGSTTITVTVYSSSNCTTQVATVTSNSPGSGSWGPTSETGNLSENQTYFARATQGSSSSGCFAFTLPDYT